MTTEQKPLPCPFCGCTNVILQQGSTFRWRVLECVDCGARCGEVRVQTIGDGSPSEWELKVAADAIDEWNKRPAPDVPAPRGKPCTCPDTSATACGVERGHRLGELWYCQRAALTRNGNA